MTCRPGESKSPGLATAVRGDRNPRRRARPRLLAAKTRLLPAGNPTPHTLKENQPVQMYLQPTIATPDRHVHDTRDHDEFLTSLDAEVRRG